MQEVVVDDGTKSDVSVTTDSRTDEEDSIIDVEGFASPEYVPKEVRRAAKALKQKQLAEASSAKSPPVKTKFAMSETASSWPSHREKSDNLLPTEMIDSVDANDGDATVDAKSGETVPGVAKAVSVTDCTAQYVATGSTVVALKSGVTTETTDGTPPAVVSPLRHMPLKKRLLLSESVDAQTTGDASNHKASEPAASQTAVLPPQADLEEGAESNPLSPRPLWQLKSPTLRTAEQLPEEEDAAAKTVDQTQQQEQSSVTVPHEQDKHAPNPSSSPRQAEKPDSALAKAEPNWINILSELKIPVGPPPSWVLRIPEFLPPGATSLANLSDDERRHITKLARRKQFEIEVKSKNGQADVEQQLSSGVIGGLQKPDTADVSSSLPLTSKEAGILPLPKEWSQASSTVPTQVTSSQSMWASVVSSSYASTAANTSAYWQFMANQYQGAAAAGANAWQSYMASMPTMATATGAVTTGWPQAQQAWTSGYDYSTGVTPATNDASTGWTDGSSVHAVPSDPVVASDSRGGAASQLDVSAALHGLDTNVLRSALERVHKTDTAPPAPAPPPPPVEKPKQRRKLCEEALKELPRTKRIVSVASYLAKMKHTPLLSPSSPGSSPSQESSPRHMQTPEHVAKVDSSSLPPPPPPPGSPPRRRHRHDVRHAHRHHHRHRSNHPASSLLGALSTVKKTEGAVVKQSRPKSETGAAPGNPVASVPALQGRDMNAVINPSAVSFSSVGHSAAPPSKEATEALRTRHEELAETGPNQREEVAKTGTTRLEEAEGTGPAQREDTVVHTVSESRKKDSFSGKELDRSVTHCSPEHVLSQQEDKRSMSRRSNVSSDSGAPLQPSVVVHVGSSSKSADPPAAPAKQRSRRWDSRDRRTSQDGRDGRDDRLKKVDEASRSNPPVVQGALVVHVTGRRHDRAVFANQPVPDARHSSPYCSPSHGVENASSCKKSHRSPRPRQSPGFRESFGKDPLGEDVSYSRWGDARQDAWSSSYEADRNPPPFDKHLNQYYGTDRERELFRDGRRSSWLSDDEEFSRSSPFDDRRVDDVFEDRRSDRYLEGPRDKGRRIREKLRRSLSHSEKKRKRRSSGSLEADDRQLRHKKGMVSPLPTSSDVEAMHQCPIEADTKQRPASNRSEPSSPTPTKRKHKKSSSDGGCKTEKDVKRRSSVDVEAKQCPSLPNRSESPSPTLTKHQRKKSSSDSSGKTNTKKHADVKRRSSDDADTIQGPSVLSRSELSSPTETKHEETSSSPNQAEARRKSMAYESSSKKRKACDDEAESPKPSAKKAKPNEASSPTVVPQGVVNLEQSRLISKMLKMAEESSVSYDRTHHSRYHSDSPPPRSAAKDSLMEKAHRSRHHADSPPPRSRHYSDSPPPSSSSKATSSSRSKYDQADKKKSVEDGRSSPSRQVVSPKPKSDVDQSTKDSKLSSHAESSKAKQRAENVEKKASRAGGDKKVKKRKHVDTDEGAKRKRPSLPEIDKPKTLSPDKEPLPPAAKVSAKKPSVSRRSSGTWYDSRRLSFSADLSSDEQSSGETESSAKHHRSSKWCERFNEKADTAVDASSEVSAAETSTLEEEPIAPRPLQLESLVEEEKNSREESSEDDWLAAARQPRVTSPTFPGASNSGHRRDRHSSHHHSRHHPFKNDTKHISKSAEKQSSQTQRRY